MTTSGIVDLLSLLEGGVAGPSPWKFKPKITFPTRDRLYVFNTKSRVYSFVATDSPISGAFDKTTIEEYPIGISYYGRLPFGEKISSASASAYNETDSADATNDVLESDTCFILENSRSVCRVVAGTSGKTYSITILAFGSNGSKFEDKITMTVTI
jgi:hypothetical protein